MSVGMNRAGELRKYYIDEGRDLLYIAEKMNYATPLAVANDLKENNIPLRPNDECKTTVPILKLSDQATSAVSYQITTKTTIYTDYIDVQNYQSAQIGIALSGKGTLTNIAVGIVFQIAFKNAPDVWYSVLDTDIASLSVDASTLPKNVAYSMSKVGGDYVRLAITTSGNGTLDANNYVMLNNIIGSFFGST